MKIIHKIDDFIYSIFSDFDINDTPTLIANLEKYYTYGSHIPKISVENGWVIIDIDSPAIQKEDEEYKKVVSLCEKGMYNEAKPILKKLIEKNPSNSEYHRIKGQILSNEGDQEEAINCLIDALRWECALHEQSTPTVSSRKMSKLQI